MGTDLRVSFVHWDSFEEEWSIYFRQFVKKWISFEGVVGCLTIVNNNNKNNKINKIIIIIKVKNNNFIL